jgi:hypothetical protein
MRAPGLAVRTVLAGGKRFSSILADAVLHRCIRLLIEARCAPSHHGYQRACDLINGQASNGPFASPVFACVGKTDPPSSSHFLADLGGCVINSLLASRCSFVRALRPFLRPGPRSAKARRAQGPSRLAVAHSLPLAPALPGYALTGPSTARGSSSSRRRRMALHALEGAPFC